ncbi:uncharacterized protein BXZ73DRAFT_53089 [Epithele typhae]|uniref:uncharacterized protein n=1 Tax=Epithele typhae TaxID=378194 RepID=UPI0020079AAC|nr:uncharacterized protein BXZ73DRAFT_53089 [Epithele typhae]KAH9918206.1 hypothetical protein BXZ73DRAFT_53089 [Epithele typhae]
MSAPFSRLQLAAALIEYDNDDDDPSKPRRNAQESALFLHFRNNNLRGPPPITERKTSDLLGVTLPSETASVVGRDSIAWDRRSRGSVDALRNPFGRDSTYEGALDEEEEEEDLEVDLASWGLDALVDKDKEKEKARQRKRAKSDMLPNPHEGPGRNARPIHSRANSATLLNGLGVGGAFLDSQSTSPSPAPAPGTPNPLSPRRHSIGDPLNLPEAHSDDVIFPPRSRSPSAHVLIDRIPAGSPLHSVPFPTSESIRSPSPVLDGRRRAMSVGSMSKILETAAPAEDTDNPFALRPPSPSRMSRFDPKAQRARTISQGTLATQMMLDYDEPQEDQPPAQPEHQQRPPTRERRYSRMELMRPKVLIMPSPLQNAPEGPQPPQPRATDGFELSVEGRPLPPGARAARRSSVTLSVMEPGLAPGGLAPPVASNSFTPNPRASLTLSQLTFRNTLMVDGQRDVAYADIDAHLRRATEDGEQIEEEFEQDEVPIMDDEPKGPKRPAGKLFGRSLIDDLEARKAEMRGKQRVFRGDDRPSMMQRTQVKRSSTLITPEELKRPASQHMNSFHSQPELQRRGSVNAKPLLDFEEGIPGAPRQNVGPAAATKSVFGVDTLWERELAKLKVIEEQERIAEEERRKREFGEEARRNKKKKNKARANDSSLPVSPAPPDSETPSPAPPELHPSSSGLSAPPLLPAIPKTARRRPPPPTDNDDDDESDNDSDNSDAPRPRTQAQTSGWHSDEDEGPRRTTGSGPRYPAAMSSGPPRLPKVGGGGGDSSEEDVPLVATIGRAVQRQQQSRFGGDDSSDEDTPLVAVLDKTKGKLPSISGGSLSLSPRVGNGGQDEDEDDKPLGLRASTAFLGSSMAGGDGDEDDMPLGMHPDQLRKSQYMMAAAQQQQQQQMFAQAQMAQMAVAHQSMYFGAPSMMGPGFFAPQMTGMSGMAGGPMMMGFPQLPPTPPPVQDTTKLVRVDKWRQDVAVEGERP